MLGDVEHQTKLRIQIRHVDLELEAIARRPTRPREA